jgi:hypothetical protein
VFPVITRRWHDTLGDQHREPANGHIEVLGELGAGGALCVH